MLHFIISEMFTGDKIYRVAVTKFFFFKEQSGYNINSFLGQQYWKKMTLYVLVQNVENCRHS